MIPHKTIWILFGLTLFSLLLVGFLAISLIQNKQENRSLKDQLEILEHSIESEKQNKLRQFDSLQKVISTQNQINSRLKISLDKYQRAKLLNNRNSDEKKSIISRINAVDSLYREIAGHYR